MSEFNKYSTDGGATFIDVEDSNAVHYGDQSKGYVGKNLLKFADPTSPYSWRGVTYTFDKTNRTFTLSGALNVDYPTYMTLVDTGTLPAGRYKLSGCPAGGGEYTYCQYIYLARGSEGIRIKDTGSGIEFDVQDGDTFMFYAPRVDINYKNQSVNGLIFKPMITRIDVPDSDYEHYEPYLTPNTEIDNKISYMDNDIVGTNNFVPIPYESTSKTSQDVTWTLNDDWTVNANGLANAVSYFAITDWDFIPNKWAGYKFSGCPNGGGGTTYRIVIDYSNNGIDWAANDNDFGDGVIIRNYPYISIKLMISNGYNASDVLFKPQLTLSTNKYNDYNHYQIPTYANRDITDKILAIKNDAANAADFAAFKSAMANI